MKTLTKKQIGSRIKRDEKTLLSLGFRKEGICYKLDLTEYSKDKLGQQIIVWQVGDSWNIKIWNKDDPKDSAGNMNGQISFSSDIYGIEHIFDTIIRNYAFLKVCQNKRKIESKLNNRFTEIINSI